MTIEPSTPAVPAASPAPAGPHISLAATGLWIAHHAVSLLIVGALALGAVYKIESIISTLETANATREQNILKAQAATVQTLTDKMKSDDARWTQIAKAYQAQIDERDIAIAKRDSALANQVKLDATLNAEQAAARIAEDIQAKPGQVVPQGDNVDLDLPAARDVTASLDRLPVAEHDLADTKSNLAAETQIAQNQAQQIAGQGTLIAAQQVELTDSQKACDAQISALRAKDRKRSLKYLLLGGAIVEGLKLYFTHSL